MFVRAERKKKKITVRKLAQAIAILCGYRVLAIDRGINGVRRFFLIEKKKT